MYVSACCYEPYVCLYVAEHQQFRVCFCIVQALCFPINQSICFGNYETFLRLVFISDEVALGKKQRNQTLLQDPTELLAWEWVCSKASSVYHWGSPGGCTWTGPSDRVVTPKTLKPGELWQMLVALPMM